MENIINIGIILTYVMIGFAALAALSFGIKKILSNTKNAKKQSKQTQKIQNAKLQTKKKK